MIDRIDKYKFEEVRKLHRLKVSFAEYPTMLIKMINNCIKDPVSYQDLFAMGVDGSADLIFQQSVEYKTIELYKCKFEQAEEESVKALVSYKFKLSNFYMKQANARLRDVSSIIKQKNPSLLTQIQNGAAQHTLEARTNYQQYQMEQ